MATEHTIDLDISARLKNDTEFRKGYFRALSRNEIAAQIIKLRKMRKMRQRDLADAVDTGQSAISRLEKADYASWSNQTLEQVAEALHARWRHILEPVEDVIRQYEHEEMASKTDTIETAYTGELVESWTSTFVEPNETKAFTKLTTFTRASASGNIGYSSNVPREDDGVILCLK